MVGIFDSGLGGLTVVKEIKRKFPRQKIIYLGDTARIPYGTRSPETIQKFAIEDAKFLESRGVSQIIIACHTASALASEQVKQSVKLPVLEMITPTIEAIKQITQNKRIGVLGTRATINSHIYKTKLPADYAVVEQACPLLVPLIEEGETDGTIIESVLQRYLQPIKESRIDTLVLACTHYPIVERIIKQELENSVKIINPGVALAERLELTRESGGEDEYYVTDLNPRYQEVAQQFLGVKISPKLVQL